MSDTPRWTKIVDAVEGVSQTNFERLYIEGDRAQAGMALYQLFDIPPTLSIRQGLDAFCFEEFSSFELASRSDRGGKGAEAWARRCEIGIQKAIDRAQDDHRCGKGAVFLASRTDVLAACLPEWDDGVVRERRLPGRMAAADELLELSRREGAAWLDHPNLTTRAKALARIVELGLRAIGSDGASERMRDRVAPWTAFGERIAGADIACALQACLGRAKHLAAMEPMGKLVDVLARAWSKGPEHPVADLLESVDAPSCDVIVHAAQAAAAALHPSDPRHGAILAFAAAMERQALESDAAVADPSRLRPRL